MGEPLLASEATPMQGAGGHDSAAKSGRGFNPEGGEKDKKKELTVPYHKLYRQARASDMPRTDQVPLPRAHSCLVGMHEQYLPEFLVSASRYATGWDWLYIVLGTIGALGNGALMLFYGPN